MLTIFRPNILGWCRLLIFEYDTPRLVTLRNPVLGIINRIVQLSILAYVIGYVFIYTKGYQEFDVAESSVVTKIKGLLLRNNSGHLEIWDSIDFVVPPQENGAFFIATNLLYTNNQRQDICPEDPNIGKTGIWCKGDVDCLAGQPSPLGNGLQTGRCVPSKDTQLNVSVCEIHGWCETELDRTPSQPVLSGFESITVLVKNSIAFPKFGKKRRNILDSINQTYLQKCRFHAVTDPLCPIFSIKDIITDAAEDFLQLATRGGIIGFNIKWECDFDYDVDYCIPHYSFRRLDSRTDKVGKGWNFRHAYYYYDANGTLCRDLIKLWGIRFIFNVNGRAGRFSAVISVMNVGSGLGLLGLASLVTEFVLLNCIRSHYGPRLSERKFTKLEEEMGTRINSRCISQEDSIEGILCQNDDHFHHNSNHGQHPAPIMLMQDI